jgi:hypothetical protein
MSSFSDALAIELLEVIRGKTFDVALYTTAPLADGTGGVEVTGGDYARVAFDGADFTVADSTRTISNTTVVEFPQHTAAWGQIKAIGFIEGSTLQLIGGISPARNVVVGQSPFQLDVGDIQVTLA